MAGKLRVMIAGGGTGGHVFPMIAVADEIKRINPDSEVVFVGTKERIESRLVPEAGYQLETIPVGGLKGKSVFNRIVNLAKLPVAIAKSAFLISKYGPNVVLGGGGFASWPLCQAAGMLKVPLALMEVNSLAGMANRKLSPMAKEAYISFSSTEKQLKCPSILTGNPVRSNLRGTAEPQREGFHVLVIGGSQGAVGLNSLVIETLTHLKGKMPFKLIHQTGELDKERVIKVYNEQGFDGQVVSFIDDMAQSYSWADLVVARAGATTVAELIAARKPSVLVPLPTAADNHQELNALELVNAGGGQMLRQQDSKGEDLASLLIELNENRTKLKGMAEALTSLDHPEAAKEIARRLMVLSGITDTEV